MTTPELGEGAALGDRRTRRHRSPFGDVAPGLAAAATWALVAAVWAAVGGGLPGGRWTAVHLFTIGVLTNAVIAFSDHFASTLTRSRSLLPPWQLWVQNGAAAAVVAGRVLSQPGLLATGAVSLAVVVAMSYMRLRRYRRQAVGARFAWVVRLYERAHGAFLHGAVLGLLLGVGWLPGSWHSSARLAHLHVMVLGWGGLTLLATMVFLGPTIARTRIGPGAEGRAAVLRFGAIGLGLGTVMLVGAAANGAVGEGARIAAAVGLAVYAWATTVVCRDVGAAALRSRAALRWPVAAIVAWFPLVAWADVALVAAGRYRSLDAAGIAVFAGVLGQAMLATAQHVVPLVRGHDAAARSRLRRRLERMAGFRTAAFNAGVVAAVVGAAAGAGGGIASAVAVRAGLISVTAVAAATIALACGRLLPVPRRSAALRRS